MSRSFVVTAAVLAAFTSSITPPHLRTKPGLIEWEGSLPKKPSGGGNQKSGLFATGIW